MLNTIVADPTENGKGARHTRECANSNGLLTDRRIAEALRRLPLNDGERATLEALLRRDFLLEGERKGFVYASNASLAAETGKTVRTVQLHLAKLRKWGIVRRDRKNPRKLFLNYRALFRKARMEDEVSRFSSPPVTLCLGCGRAFSPTRPDKRYCNATCRKRAQRAREREKRLRQKSVTPPVKKRDALLPASQREFLMRGEIRCTPGVKNISPPPARFTSPSSATDAGFRVSPSAPKKRRLYKLKEDDNNVVQRLVTVVEGELRHPKLKGLCRRLDAVRRLFWAFHPDRVIRALKQADLQYANGRRIENPYGLIYTMCRDLDDTLLREREEAERRRREQEEHARKLRELQERGCKRCGFWDVGLDGYCSDCRPSVTSAGDMGVEVGGGEPWRPLSLGAVAAGGS